MMVFGDLYKSPLHIQIKCCKVEVPLYYLYLDILPLLGLNLVGYDPKSNGYIRNIGGTNVWLSWTVSTLHADFFLELTITLW